MIGVARRYWRSFLTTAPGNPRPNLPATRLAAPAVRQSFDDVIQVELEFLHRPAKKAD